jgi:hypothetical protein
VNDFDSKKPYPEGALEDWANGASYGWLATKYGRSYSTISKMVGQAQKLGRQRVVDLDNRRRGGRKAFSEQSAISPMHRNVGVKLNFYREVQHDMNYEELGAKLGLNRLVVRKMELGIHDFTLSQIDAVSKLLDKPITELMKPGT